MKKNMLKIATIMLLAASLGSCVKGDKGDAGPAGANGTNGTNGANGNANVHGGTITMTAADWTYNSGAWQYYTFLTSSGITQSVVDYGTVQMFVLVGNNPTVWQPLPYTIIYSSTQSYIYGFNYYLGGARLYMQMSDNSTFSTINPATFKMVVIDGTLRKAHPNTNWNNYEEVMKVVNAEENQ